MPKSAEMEPSEELVLLSEKTLHQPVCGLMAYCPSMDLLALGSTDHGSKGKDQQVLIFRLNGQRVYGTSQKGTALTVDQINWKPNGQLLGIAWSDGVVRLVGAESSKTVHQISTGTESSGVSCLGWASNLMGRNPLQPARTSSSWKGVEEVLHELELEDQKPLDLPRDLSLIDIEASMPQLSVLPAGATAYVFSGIPERYPLRNPREDIFSTRASIDGLFRPFDPKDNDAVDVMVVGTKNGQVYLSIYDSFVVGSFPSPLTASQRNHITYHLVRHASNKLYSTHALLFAPPRADRDSPNRLASLYFVPMDLRFVSASSGYLSLLASKSTALQNLLRYIDQVQILMGIEWEATQDLPRKFLRNINESLAESKRGSDIVQAMYHSVATGHTFPAVREWLVDELAERGHKRWDKAVITGLENLRNLVHENMLPALERCSVILSRLAGIAKYQGSNDTMGFSSHQISLVMDTVACLNLVCAKILIYTVDELDMFTAFSTWLRYEIDRLASDASTSPDNDIVEKESTIDHSKVLLYIQTSMTNSRLGAFFKNPHGNDEREGWEDAQKGLPLFQFVDKDLQRNEDGLKYSNLTRLDVLVKYLDHQATTVFEQIAEAEKRNILFGQAVDLGIESNGQRIIRVCTEDSTSCQIYIGLVHDLHKLSMFCITLKIENGISTQTSVTKAELEFGRQGIFDAGFVNDHRLMILSATIGERFKLLSIDYRKSLKYQPYKSSQPASANKCTIEDIAAFTKSYEFPRRGTFIPERIKISESSNKHGEKVGKGLRICVLDKSQLQYRVFTIQEKELGMTDGNDEDDDEDVQMTQE